MVGVMGTVQNRITLQALPLSASRVRHRRLAAESWHRSKLMQAKAPDWLDEETENLTVRSMPMAPMGGWGIREHDHQPENAASLTVGNQTVKIVALSRVLNHTRRPPASAPPAHRPPPAPPSRHSLDRPVRRPLAPPSSLRVFQVRHLPCRRAR